MEKEEARLGKGRKGRARQTVQNRKKMLDKGKLSKMEQDKAR